MARQLLWCYSSTDIQALMRDPNQERKTVYLASLESLSVASEAYGLLHQRSWMPGNMDILLLFAGVDLELRKVERDLMPRLLVHKAKPDGGVLEALLLLRSSAFPLIHLGEAIKEKFREKGESFDISEQVINLGKKLKDTADEVLCGQKIGWSQRRARHLAQKIKSLLATPVHFTSISADNQPFLASS